MARYEVNDEAVEAVSAWIATRQYVLDSEWNEVQPDADAENAYLETHSYRDYSRWHLGLTVDATPETKGRYAFGVGDFRRVHRSALIACVFRAAQWRHKAVERAAYDLLQELDEKAGIPKDR